MELLEAIKEWAAVGVLIGGILYGLLRKIFKKKHSTIDNDVKFNVPIYDILIELLFRYPATRTFIKQFHNGNEYYSGQKIQRLSMSHEKCRPWINPMKPYHDNIQVPTEVHDVINQMDDNRADWYWISDVDKCQENFPEMYRWMKSYDVISLLYFRLHDKKSGETIGLMGMTFNHRFRLDDVIDILDIIKKKKEIETEFMKV
jgi:hypothetical protein